MCAANGATADEILLAGRINFWLACGRSKANPQKKREPESHTASQTFIYAVYRINLFNKMIEKKSRGKTQMGTSSGEEGILINDKENRP